MLTQEGLWTFAKEYYGSQSALYLQCQDQFGLNVNMILFCQYLNDQELCLTPEQWKGLEKNNQLLCEQIHQLRQIRREVKTQCPSAYESILQGEIELEKQHLYQLIEQTLALRPLDKGTGNIRTLVEVISSLQWQQLPDIIQRLDNRDNC